MKPIILFESRPDFNGSALEIYNKLKQLGYEDKYDLIWAVDKDFKNNNLEFKTVKFFRTSESNRKKILSKTKIIIDSNRFIHKLNCNKRIHVRHGCCLKNCRKYHNHVGPVDAIVTTSDEMLKCEQHAWPKEVSNKFIITGMPACDRIFLPKNLYDCGFIKSLTNQDKKFTKIIGWLPTFRQRHVKPEKTEEKRIFKFGLPIINTIEDYNNLNTILAKHNILLLIQLHHIQAKNYIQLENLSNIYFINESIKQKFNLATTDLLGNFDALISDYSAVYHEYVILNRPIALTVDDLIEYNRAYGFFVNYLDWAKGDYLIDNLQLINWINNIANNIDVAKQARLDSLYKIHKYIDANATDRVVNYIIKTFKL